MRAFAAAFWNLADTFLGKRRSLAGEPSLVRSGLQRHRIEPESQPASLPDQASGVALSREREVVVIEDGADETRRLGKRPWIQQFAGGMIVHQ